jgi:hypothetical protein
MTRRRDFLARLTAGAAALAFDADELHAATHLTASGPWDTSWIDRVGAAQYRVVFNASDISYGAALNHDEVRAELRANLVPGAILVPSGIYALIRAQNAGCAFMPGT